MKTYKIELRFDGHVQTETWSHYDEQGAIAQAFLYHAQQGARSIEVLSIELK